MIGWNKAHAEATPKEEWVKQHAHIGDEDFLGAEYDKLVPPKKEPKAVAKPRAKVPAKSGKTK